MKYIFIFSMLAMISSCAHYSFTLIRPEPVSQMVFENDTMRVEFFIKDAPVSEVDFKLTNKLNTPIKIVWDDGSLATNGFTYKIVHKNTNMMVKDLAMPPTSIAGHQYLKDVIVPSEKIRFVYHRRTGIYEWVVKPFLPERRSKSKVFENGSLVLLLPVMIEEKHYYPSFEFRINLIKSNAPEEER